MSQRLNDMDGSRSTADGHRNIKTWTGYENRLKPIFALDMQERWNIPSRSIIITDGGVDNSGEPIDEDTKVSHKADWNCCIMGFVSRIEAMVHWTFSTTHGHRLRYTSLKESKVKYAIRNNVFISVFREHFYLVFTPYALQWITQNRPVVPTKLGGKLGYQFDENDIKGLVKDNILISRPWMPRAHDLMLSFAAETFKNIPLIG